jgi:hypothetical protein
MSETNNDDDLARWDTMCRGLYGLTAEDTESAKRGNRDSDLNSKLKVLESCTPSPLTFLNGKDRLYRKFVTKNDTAEYRLREALSRFQINIDDMWAKGAARNSFPCSTLTWDRFGGSYAWTDVDFHQLKGIESKKVIGEVYGRLMPEESRIILSLYPTEVDIASAIIGEHLLPASKALRMIELFVCLYAYLGGPDGNGGWASLNVVALLNCNRYVGNTAFIDMLFFVVRVFGRAVMVLKRDEASALFNMVGCQMNERIAAFNGIVAKIRCRKRKRSVDGNFVDGNHHRRAAQLCPSQERTVAEGLLQVSARRTNKKDDNVHVADMHKCDPKECRSCCLFRDDDTCAREVGGTAVQCDCGGQSSEASGDDKAATQEASMVAIPRNDAVPKTLRTSTGGECVDDFDRVTSIVTCIMKKVKDDIERSIAQHMSDSALVSDISAFARHRK